MEMGIKVRDSITGFSGVVTGTTSYITGCAQALVQPPTKETGEFVDGRWFDVTRLEVIDPNPIAIDTDRGAGPDAPAPIK